MAAVAAMQQSNNLTQRSDGTSGTSASEGTEDSGGSSSGGGTGDVLHSATPTPPPGSFLQLGNLLLPAMLFKQEAGENNSVTTTPAPAAGFTPFAPLQSGAHPSHSLHNTPPAQGATTNPSASRRSSPGTTSGKLAEPQQHPQQQSTQQGDMKVAAHRGSAEHAIHSATGAPRPMFQRGRPALDLGAPYTPQATTQAQASQTAPLRPQARAHTPPGTVASQAQGETTAGIGRHSSMERAAIHPSSDNSPPLVGGAAAASGRHISGSSKHVPGLDLGGHQQQRWQQQQQEHQQLQEQQAQQQQQQQRYQQSSQARQQEEEAVRELKRVGSGLLGGSGELSGSGSEGGSSGDSERPALRNAATGVSVAFPGASGASGASGGAGHDKAETTSAPQLMGLPPPGMVLPQLDVDEDVDEDDEEADQDEEGDGGDEGAGISAVDTSVSWPVFKQTSSSCPNFCGNCGTNVTSGCWRRGWTVQGGKSVNLCNKCGLRYKSGKLAFDNPFGEAFPLQPPQLKALKAQAAENTTPGEVGGSGERHFAQPLHPEHKAPPLKRRRTKKSRLEKMASLLLELNGENGAALDKKERNAQLAQAAMLLQAQFPMLPERETMHPQARVIAPPAPAKESKPVHTPPVHAQPVYLPLAPPSVRRPPPTFMSGPSPTPHQFMYNPQIGSSAPMPAMAFEPRALPPPMHWSLPQVVEWLKYIRCAEAVPNFVNNGLDGMALKGLYSISAQQPQSLLNMLKQDIGVAELGCRLRLVEHILNLFRSGEGRRMPALPSPD